MVGVELRETPSFLWAPFLRCQGNEVYLPTVTGEFICGFMTPRGNTVPCNRAEQATSSPLVSPGTADVLLSKSWAQPRWEHGNCGCGSMVCITPGSVRWACTSWCKGYSWLSSPVIHTWLHPFLLRKMPTNGPEQEFWLFYGLVNACSQPESAVRASGYPSAPETLVAEEQIMKWECEQLEM